MGSLGSFGGWLACLIERKVCRKKIVKEDGDKETKEALRKDKKQTLYR